MLFVVGYHASGKSHLAKLLEREYGALHIETSLVVKSLKALEAPSASLGEWARAKEEEYGPTFFDEVIVNEVRERYLEALESGREPSEVIITGNRSLSGIQYAAEHLSDIHTRPTKIFAVDVEEEIRYERFRMRDRREGDSTMPRESFDALTKEEQDTGIDEIFLNADLILSNNGSPIEFAEFGRIIAEHELSLRRYNNEGEDTHIINEGNHKQG